MREHDIPLPVIVDLVPTTLTFDEWIARAARASNRSAILAFISRAFTSDESASRSYDALVYADPRLGLPHGVTPPPGRDAECAGLPLVAVERVVIRWQKYRDYIGASVSGPKTATAMRNKLFDTLSPGLKGLFSSMPLEGKSVRIWFSSSEAPEVQELPWELVAYDDRKPPSKDYTFVRGRPPDILTPAVPVQDRLRLAVVGPRQQEPPALTTAFERIAGMIDVIRVEDSIRPALHRIVRDGVELVHVVADGEVSLAREGLLVFDDRPGEARAERRTLRRENVLGPAELSVIATGSRMTVLCFSPTRETRRDLFERHKQIRKGTTRAPNAYRAFPLFAATDYPMPTILAPTLPGNDGLMTEFWSGFYQSLAETLSVEDALLTMRQRAAATLGTSALPIGLYLNQVSRKTFERLVSKDALRMQVHPAQLSSRLRQSVHLSVHLKDLETAYGELPPAVKALAMSEDREQARLREHLSTFYEKGEIV